MLASHLIFSSSLTDYIDLLKPRICRCFLGPFHSVVSYKTTRVKMTFTESWEQAASSTPWVRSNRQFHTIPSAMFCVFAETFVTEGIKSPFHVISLQLNFLDVWLFHTLSFYTKSSTLALKVNYTWMYPKVAEQQITKGAGWWSCRRLDTFHFTVVSFRGHFCNI